jgi:hypothetical protein
MTLIFNGTTGITSPGGDTSTSLTTSGLTIGTTPIGAGDSTRFKNRIINGDMRIDQRNAGASVTPTSGTYSVDRFKVFCSQSSKLSFQQNAGSVTPPAGFTNYLGITSLSAYSVLTADEFGIYQAIEGYNMSDLVWGTANAKTVTLSFWVRSSLTGTFGGGLRNVNTDRSYPFSYTISSANTWEQKSVTIAGDTTGTWNTTNGAGIYLSLNLGAGSTLSTTANAWATGNYLAPTGATSVVGTNGATFYFTGVQLEVGASATGFEYVDYGTQEAMCQRYFFRKNIVSTSADFFTTLQAYSTSAAYGKFCDLPVTMRTTPTGTLSAIGHFRASNASAGSAAVFTGGSIDSLSPTSIGTTGMTGSSGLVAGSATVISANTTSAWIAASAEL